MNLERKKLDQYPTPDWQTWALLKHVRIAGVAIEPCVGAGAIIAAAFQTERNLEFRNQISRWWTNDIDENYEACFNLDATTDEYWKKQVAADWVVTNPPFNAAFSILQKAHRHVIEGVALLLRLSFLEPTAERGNWLRQHPPEEMIILPRTRYRTDVKGTDSVTTAWMIWRKPKASLTDSEVPAIRVVTRESALMIASSIRAAQKPQGELIA